MSLSDQENYEQPAKRRKKVNSGRPFALSQQITMETTPSAKKSMKRTPSTAVNSPATKRVRTQGSFFSVYDEESSSLFEESSAGVVRSVRLVNFMCHSHFEINFNPRINFISGRNGSGKSAIQTAMVVGLGGAASKTNRSSKIDGLIKHGCNNGTIVITLSNTGNNSYKPEEYGNLIRITRNITPSSSSYKIQNQWGNVMASNKKELDNILTRFRIQPNNPVSILNQDSARNFLSTNKAEAKYALFRKATLLDEADELLGKIYDEVQEQEVRCESKKRGIAQVQEEIEKMGKKMQLVEDLKVSKQKKFALENELVWSKVNGFRGEVDHLAECRDNQITIRNDFQSQLEKLKANEEVLIESKNKCERDIASIQEESRTKEEARQQLETEFRRLKKEYQDKCMACEDVDSKLKARKRDRGELKRGLDDTQRQEIEQKQIKEEALLQRSKLKEELDVIESKQSVLDQEMTRLKTTAEHYQEKIASQRQLIQDARDQIGILERRIQSSGSKSDNLSMYEAWMPALLQKINEAVNTRKFSKPPRGPLGRYVKVKDEKWIYCIESNLSINLLSSFLVNNVDDRRLLYSIMDQVIRSGHKPTVHCSLFQEEDRREILPGLETSYPGYANMLKTLTISDMTVHNFLMDYRNIHRILLVEKDEDCRNFIKEDRNIPNRCNLILNLGADQFQAGFKVYANMDRSGRARILRKSAADQLRLFKEEVAEKQEFIARVNQGMEGYRMKLNEHTDQIKQISQDLEKVRNKIIDNKIKIKDLSAVIEMETPSLQMKMDEIRELDAEITSLEENLTVLTDERTEAQRYMLDAKTKMTTEYQNDFFAQQKQLNIDKEKYAKQLSLLSGKITVLNNKINEQEKKLENLNSRIIDTQEKLTAEEYSASQLTEEELVTNRSAAEIQKELKEIESFITEAQKKLGASEHRVEKAYIDQKEKLCNQVGTFKELTSLSHRVKQMHHSRKGWIGKLRDINASIIMAQFQTVLKSRNYRGTLKFDHVNKKLDILMSPIDGGDTLMNTSSLSGGEKSYSTVAFLLALWSNMELPFYSMDEYDVFMDAINRKTITQLLMAFAEKKLDRQFIFLTPLDVSIIKPGENVQVHRVNKIQN